MWKKQISYVKKKKQKLKEYEKNYRKAKISIIINNYLIVFYSVTNCSLSDSLSDEVSSKL